MDLILVRTLALLMVALKNDLLRIAGSTVFHSLDLNQEGVMPLLVSALMMSLKLSIFVPPCQVV